MGCGDRGRGDPRQWDVGTPGNGMRGPPAMGCGDRGRGDPQQWERGDPRQWDAGTPGNGMWGPGMRGPLAGDVGTHGRDGGTPVRGRRDPQQGRGDPQQVLPALGESRDWGPGREGSSRGCLSAEICPCGKPRCAQGCS